jgi:hypothetical protein
MRSITLDSIVLRKENNLMGGEMGNETVLMDMNTGDYIGLNSVGTSIWKLVATPSKVADICAQLQEEYNVDAETCQVETLKYLEMLQSEKILDIQN